MEKEQKAATEKQRIEKEAKIKNDIVIKERIIKHKE